MTTTSGSGSNLYRIEACGGELVLPQTREAESVYCSYGSVMHAFLSAVSQVGREEALARAPEEHRDALALVDVEALPSSRPEQYASEVAFAYEWRTDKARELGRGMNRDYSGLAGDELPGTADVVGVTEDAVVVFDFKNGFAPLGPVKDSLQLQFYALSAARAYGKERAIIGFICRLDGDPIYSRAELDSLDLDAAAARIRAVMERPAIAIPEGLVQGGHCRYCPSFGACPAKVALLRSILADQSPVLNSETAPALFARLLLAEEVLEKVRAMVQEYARATPIHLPGGEVFGLVDVGRESIDADLAAPVLASLYGPGVAAGAIEIEKKLTKAALKRALKDWVKTHPEWKLTKLEQAALDALRANGACVKKFHHEMKVHRPALPDGGA